MLVEYADPFWGNRGSEYRKPEGTAANWFFIKAQSGNTTPAASRPFSMVRAAAYTGGYPTGYGVNAPNTHGRPMKLWDRPRADGFTHFSVSGTGAIGYYYNFLKVSPYSGSIKETEYYYELEEEKAYPGYYSARLKESGIRAELTVTEKGALHRYQFPENTETAGLRIEINAEGLSRQFGSGYYSEAEKAAVRLSGQYVSGQCVSGQNGGPGAGAARKAAESARGTVQFHGFALYFCVAAEEGAECCLYERMERTEQRYLEYEEKVPEHIGLIVRKPGGRLEIAAGFSFRSEDQAVKNCEQARSTGFSGAVRENTLLWETLLGKIQVDAEEEEKELFYSAFYTSALKPMECRGESPYWEEEEYFTDYATLWDIYKTQLPLLFLIAPEKGAGIVNSLLRYQEKEGRFSNYFVLAEKKEERHPQARMLAAYIVTDAYYKRIPDIDYENALRALLKGYEKEENRDFLESGLCGSYAHVLDLADTAACLSDLAQQLYGEEPPEDIAGAVKRMKEYEKRWIGVYDRNTGVLKEDAEYYEGTNWNYSFRLLHAMEERMELCGGKTEFGKLLDRFFGYGAGSVKQIEDAGDAQYYQWGHRLHRFEGFNNEPDMESPYNYSYAGRFDRLCEVIRFGMRSLFHTGPGGIPGNEDSGGMASCLVFNMLGIFPVCGSDHFMLGSPSVHRASLTLRQGRILRIKAIGGSRGAIYVKEIRWNGKYLERPVLPVSELLCGGELEFYMTERIQECGYSHAENTPG